MTQTPTSDAIFVARPPTADDRPGTPTLQRMKASHFGNEDDLQQLIADYPDLLGGGQIDEDEPRRWLLLQREQGIAIDEGRGAHFAVDHLFVDQDGIPTLVEVKRANDLRARREVVAQMLDYAANATLYLDANDLRSAFDDQGEEARERLEAFLFDTADLSSDAQERKVDELWRNVARNLQAKKIRMLFVADRIPRELRAIVEFLNEQMDRCEVLAVEVQRYAGADESLVLVPRLYGQTIDAQKAKAGSSAQTPLWTEERHRAEIESNWGATVARTYDRLVSALDGLGVEWTFGRGVTNGWRMANFETPAGPLRLFGLATKSNSGIEVRFEYLAQFPPFDHPARVEQFRSDLAACGIELPESNWAKFRYELLNDETTLQRFVDIVQRVLGDVRANAKSDASR